MLIIIPGPYSGAGLWILQFFAMLMKRFYVAVRFWQVTLPQYLIPILSVLVALVIVMFLPNKRGNDPKRALTLSNSAIDPSNRFLFWADVGENSTNLFNFRVRSVHTHTKYFNNSFFSPLVHKC